MSDKKVKIRYIDNRPIYFLKIGKGIKKPKHKEEFEVTERQLKFLMKMKNGIKPMFEVVRPPKEVNDDSR